MVTFTLENVDFLLWMYYEQNQRKGFLANLSMEEQLSSWLQGFFFVCILKILP